MKYEELSTASIFNIQDRKPFWTVFFMREFIFLVQKRSFLWFKKIYFSWECGLAFYSGIKIFSFRYTFVMISRIFIPAVTHTWSLVPWWLGALDNGAFKSWSWEQARKWGLKSVLRLSFRGSSYGSKLPYDRSRLAALRRTMSSDNFQQWLLLELRPLIMSTV